MANKKKLVFVVEDNKYQQKMLEVHLKEILGEYEVKTFGNPVEMMSHLIEEEPYAIVLDHFFEGQTKTGFDYIASIKKSHKHLPIIYHTTLDDEKVRKQVIDAGAEAYIVKDSASLVRLRTALDTIQERYGKRGFFGKLFGG